MVGVLPGSKFRDIVAPARVGLVAVSEGARYGDQCEPGYI
ncbi:hypothetical protein RHOER0001_0550 [Rhodococcus erythropolis SK121]|nr:hypothetical protein RHOER0001_0550 [Rhodococcus erythropolis SK121]